MKFLSRQDLEQLAPMELVFESLGAAPASPVAGRVYYDTALNVTRIYQNGQWVNIEVGDAGSAVTDTLANRPASAADGALYYATDTQEFYIYNGDGSQWILLAKVNHNHDSTYVNETDHTAAAHNSLAIDHGSLSGGGDDDHTQYLNNGRHDVTTRHTAGTVLPTAVPGTATFGAAAAEGISGSVSRADHVHGMPSHTKADHDALNIDADTLDGIDSTGFSSSTHNHDGTYAPVHSHPYASDTHNHDSAYVNVTGDTISGALFVDGASNLKLRAGGTADHVYMEYYADSAAQGTRSAYVGYPAAGSTTFHINNQMTGGSINLVAGGGVSVGGNRILTVADEGAGNGLDADTVDGQHASAFAVSAHNHDAAYVNEGDHTKAAHDSLLIDADTVDGQHASAFAAASHGTHVSLADAAPGNTASSTGAVGVGTQQAREDHSHGYATGTPSTQTFGDAAAVGAANAIARSDHKHAMPADPLPSAKVYSRSMSLLLGGM